MKIINKTILNPAHEVYVNNVNIILLDSMKYRHQTFYINSQVVFFGTIYQNITKFNNNFNINIFNIKEIKWLLHKYRIKLQKLVETDKCLKIEKEWIELLSIFYNKATIVILDKNFKYIQKRDINTVLKVFNDVISGKFLILN